MPSPLRVLIYEAKRIKDRLARLKPAVAVTQQQKAPRQQAEDALRESETRYRSLFDGVPVGLYCTTPEGCVLDANMAFVQMLGYPDRQSLLAVNVNDFFAQPADRLRWQVMFQREKTVRDFKTQLRRYDGTIIRVLDNARAILAADGRIQCYEGSLLDITERELAEEALREKEERLAELFDGAPIGYHELDISGRITRVNHTELEMLGYTAEEMLGQPVWKFVVEGETSRQTVLAKLAGSLPPGKGFERTYRRKDGTPLPVLIEDRLLRDAENRIRGIRSILQDITERKLAEQQLSRERELMNALMEHTPDHVYFKDAESRFVRVSRAMAKWFGLDEPAQAICKTDFDFFDLEHAELARADELKIMKTGEPVVGIEEREVWPDGRVTWVSTTKVPLRNRNGQIIGTFGTSRNITEHKRAEEALRLARFSLDSAGDAVFWLGPDAAFSYVSDAACRLLGYSREELLRMTVHDVNPAHPKEVWPTHWAELQQQKLLTFEASLRTKDGRSVAVELTANHLEFEGKEYDCAFARDITERKRAEEEKLALTEQLRQAQKMEAIGRLAGGIAHDFNNLLTAINGYSDFLLSDLAPDDPKRSDLEHIKEAGQRAASLTTQLLAFSRKQMLQPKILDLNDAITEASKILRRLIGEDIDLVTVTKPGLGLIKADPGQIQQILMNLAVNARDAMPRGGKLTLETANVDLDEHYVHLHPIVPPGRYVMLAVSDTGIGMDDITKAHLFEPFFTTKEMGKGTGLGLSTIYGIVKQSSGFIWVYSEPRRGTTFKIYLPRVEREVDTFAPHDREDIGLQGVETVLVVEDDSSVRSLVIRALSKRGYNVLEASTGKEALRTAREFAGKIHLLLTDVVMPGMSGKTLASQIETARAGIKVLFVSGYTDNAVVHHGVLDSNVAFLQKPFTTDVLARKVREVIDSVA